MVLFSSFNHFNIFLLFAYLGLSSGLIFFLVFNLSKYIKVKNKKYLEAQKENKKHKVQKNLSTVSNQIVEKIKEENIIEESTVFENNTILENNRKKPVNKDNLKNNKIKKDKNNNQKDKKKLKQKLTSEEKQKLKQQKNAFKQERKQQKLEKKKFLKKQRKEKVKLIYLKIWNKVVFIFKKIQNVLLTVLCVFVLAGVVLGSYYANFVLNYGYFRIVFVAVWLGCFFLGGFIQKKVAKFLASFYNKVCKQKHNFKPTKTLVEE